MIHDPRTLSGPSATTPPRHLVEQLKAATRLHPSGEITDTANNEPVLCDKQFPVPVASESSPRLPKRSNSELQTSTSPGEEPSTDSHSDHKLSVSGSDVGSYQDCVNLIFEKDADVENGVFCGLCLDRYEAKMIPEPPDILVQPDFDFLVRHCMTMHPTVWDYLRRKA
ncbi:hypothetical protein J3R82DRAFT_4192 [Butyriboletus roseoflavus]|nr:hypothetical protein J3R82DRAFT_4192 [Butyriboletus roseoflavus]